MRTSLFPFISILLLFVFFSGLKLFAQVEFIYEDWECGTNIDLKEYPEFKMNLNQLGGRYITSEGTIKALVVFVQFSDDSDPNGDWAPGEPPSFMKCNL